MSDVADFIKWLGGVLLALGIYALLIVVSLIPIVVFLKWLGCCRSCSSNNQKDK